MNSPFEFGLLDRMRRFFAGNGDVRECLDVPADRVPDQFSLGADVTCTDSQDFDFLSQFHEPSEGAKSISVESAPDFLKKALGHMEDRAVTYDAPGGERSMGKTVAMFNALTDAGLTEEQGWLFMALLKIVRSTQGNFKADNYEDLAAYAGLAGEAAAKARGS